MDTLGTHTQKVNSFIFTYNVDLFIQTNTLSFTLRLLPFFTHPVPALQCASLVSANGAVELTWTYNHTGGLPLTRLSVSYTAIDDSGSAITIPSPVTVSSVDATSVTISTLEAGFEYGFNITAENKNGSSSIQCGPIPHVIGKAA